MSIKRFTLPPNVSDQLRAFIHANPDAFIQAEMKIEDIARAGGLTDFHYNFEQQQIRRFHRWHEVRGLPCFGIFVKTRQRGVSTLECIRNWVLTWSGDSMLCMTIAQREETATSLLEKMKAAYMRLPHHLKQKLSHDSDQQIAFEESLSKQWIASTSSLASIKDALRGKTAHRFHATEFPLWPDFLFILSELLSMCHKVPGASGILEATGSGRGSEAHKFYKLSKLGKTPFTAFFLAWQNDRSTDLDGGTWSEDEQKRRMFEVADYDYRLIERGQKYNLTYGQIFYCYLYLRDVKLGLWPEFLEDMPCDDEECWQAKAQLYYDDNQRIRVNDQIKDAPFLAFKLGLTELEEGFKKFKDLRESDQTFESTDPVLFVWSPPSPNGEYVIGAHSTAGNIDGEPSASYVINKLTGEMMAHFLGAVKPHQHGVILDSVGRIYNNAIIAPDVKTGEGVATLAELSRLRYPRPYFWKHFDDGENKMTSKLGWWSGTKTKEMTLNLLGRVLQQAAIGPLPIHKKLLMCPGLIHEMGTFFEDPTYGFPEAARIFALAITWYVADMETRGWQDSALESLRPCQIITPGSTMKSKPMLVSNAIAKAKERLIKDVGSFHGEQEREQWWER